MGSDDGRLDPGEAHGSRGAPAGMRRPSDAQAFGDDGWAAADVLAHAFRDNPMNQAVLRRSPIARVRANRLGARLLLGRARAAGHVLVHAGETGADVGPHEGSGTTGSETEGHGSGSHSPRGVLIGFEPFRPVSPPPSFEQLMLWLRQGPRATWRWGAVQRALTQIRPSVAHWTLAMVGVRPEHQGAGVGAALVGRWVEGIGRDPAPAWVETDRPELVPFYRRFGFEPEARRRIYGVEVVGLWRPAA